MDNDLDNSSLGDAVAYTLNAPLSWSSISDEDQSNLDESNEKTLRVLLSLNELPVEHSEDIAALDFKLNIVMELMSELLSQQLKLPSKKKVRLGANQLVWKLDKNNVPTLNDEIEVSVFMHASYPKPLLLRGKVISIDSDCCVLDILEQSEVAQEILEKFIFMHHRHAIALTRQAQ